LHLVIDASRVVAIQFANLLVVVFNVVFKVFAVLFFRGRFLLFIPLIHHIVVFFRLVKHTGVVEVLCLGLLLVFVVTKKKFLMLVVHPS